MRNYDMNDIDSTFAGWRTVRQAAAQLERPMRTVQLWCATGLLACIYVNGRRLIRQADLNAFVPPKLGRPFTKPPQETTR